MTPAILEHQQYILSRIESWPPLNAVPYASYQRPASLQRPTVVLRSFFDRNRLESSLSGEFKTAPSGLTREQKRDFMSGAFNV